MKKSILLLTLFLLASILSSPQNVDAQNCGNWLQFRGQNGWGIAPADATPPIDFGTEKNVLWKINVPEGYSSPCVCKENLIITGVNREKKEYYVWNIRNTDGAIKWKHVIPVDTFEFVHPVSSPAAATPASDGKYIYCYFPSFGLICYDFEGKEIWKTPIEFLPVFYGSGTSPILYEDKLILNHDNNVKPRLLVFDKTTGKQIWKYNFHKYNSNPVSTSYSTPAVWNEQVIIHRLGQLIGIDIHTGKYLWHYEIGTEGTGTPVIKDDTLFVNAWIVRGEKALNGDIENFQTLFAERDRDKNNAITNEEFTDKVKLTERVDGETTSERSAWYLNWRMLKNFDMDKNDTISKPEWDAIEYMWDHVFTHGLIAIQLGDTGNITLSGHLWKIVDNIPETPSVLVKDGLLYMVKNGGKITCVNAEDGNILYFERLGASGTYLSSPMYADGKIYLASFNGRITIIKEGREFEIINQIDLKDKIGASPVAIGNKLFIRTHSYLYAFGK
ncbi:MAG: PQQ-binding-like beta-propeller repeat protein [Bacteroidota bacterium]